MNADKMMKEQIINNYISEYITSNDDIDVYTMKTQLRDKLGEMPDIQINYSKDKLIVEKNGKLVETKIDKLKSISIYFTHGDYSKPSVGKLEFLL